MKLSRKNGMMLASLSIFALGLSACTGAVDEVEDVTDTGDIASTEESSESAAYDPFGHIDFSSYDSASLDPAVDERGFLLLQEWHDLFPEDEVIMREVLDSLSQDPRPVDVEVTEPIELVMMFPSLEISDAFARLQLSIEGHLDAMGIPYNITEFFTNAGEHQVQAGQIDKVLASVEQYDYVIIGPSEYLVQKDNIGRLSEAIPTLVMNVVNPFPDTVGTAQMPLAHVSFDHSEGAAKLADYVLETEGSEGTFALQRYLPGLIDSGRSDEFAKRLQDAGWELVDEYAGNGDQELSFTGSNAMLSANPDLDLIHNGSTAGALGTLAALAAQGKGDEVLTNGWGGGQDELDSMLEGELDFTLFRVNDDWGAGTAEVIRLHLEGKPVPVVLSPSMKVLDKSMTQEMIDAETEYAFRYSGVLER